jgi:hypothetical protein
MMSLLGTIMLWAFTQTTNMVLISLVIIILNIDGDMDTKTYKHIKINSDQITKNSIPQKEEDSNQCVYFLCQLYHGALQLQMMAMTKAPPPDLPDVTDVRHF